jgi:hypothetical protein
MLVIQTFDLYCAKNVQNEQNCSPEFSFAIICMRLMSQLPDVTRTPDKIIAKPITIARA